MAQPIRPEDVAEAKIGHIPGAVIEAFNKLIALNFSRGSATVRQNDVIVEITGTTEFSRAEIFDKGYLNVEEIFRRAGWKVSYTKPDYTESFPAYFEFRK
ncbi:hypothetical protein OIU34_20510 [Pararhizobium sp. BT-229]|uniref:hypothetical protein n=1 Tax=Pararhizobium sp. BT-229 TaxID=2986923 RepID=UPI0021F6BE99|nr:hypothetical protein [Pararhizobium sp. BT-229]MCV9964272.1 hypothetical protein [Pararhizobium sp. BT-229]